MSKDGMDMIRDILTVLGGALGMILRFILIIALALGGVYSFGTMFMFPFIWEGLHRLGIASVCAACVFGVLRIGREKDDEEDEVTKDDFRP